MDTTYTGSSVMKTCHKWVSDCSCEKPLDVIEIQPGKHRSLTWEASTNPLFKPRGRPPDNQSITKTGTQWTKSKNIPGAATGLSAVVLVTNVPV